MKKIIAIALQLFLLVIPARLLAWNGVGHSTGGALTYYILKRNNPAIVTKILATLAQHPWYANRWHDKLAGLTAEQKDVALFMLASTFPDDAKGTPYDHRTWHYIDYPFAPAGQGGTPHAAPVPNAEVQIAALLTSLRNAPDSPDKAVNVCWLLHLVEDIHQPLHSAALFTSTFPNGDKGGNDVYIKLNPANAAVKLHSYWDGLISGSFNTIPGMAVQRLNSPHYALQALPELNGHPQLHQWIFDESFALAKSAAYANGSINGDQQHPVTVNAAYMTNAKVIADKRIVLAGFRLAKLFQTVYTAA